MGRVTVVTLLVCALTGCSESHGLLLSPAEKVVGRTGDARRVRLLTTRPRLVSVRLSDGRAVSQPITGLRSHESPWGLADTADGLVTLLGPVTAARLGPEGRVTNRVGLPQPHVSLFGLGGSVLMQPASPIGDQPVLRRVDLVDGQSRPVGSLRSSQFETRAETLARNLVGCGSTQVDELPCWFNHDLAIDRISNEGGGRAVPIRLPGLEEERSRHGVHGIGEPGPIVDAHIDQRRSLWVLLRQPASLRAPFVVARFSDSGRLARTTELTGRPRLILNVEGDTCLLLVGTGQLVSVTVS